MPKLLIVDDEENIRKIITKYAAMENYDVKEAANGLTAIELCKKNDFDLIVMDIMMPELDGFSASREIRKFSDVPIIVLSARGEEYDKIHGFETGIDDYVVKPFSPRELLLRINAILSRRVGKKSEDQTDVYEKEGLKIDFTGRIVYIDGAPVSMTPKEYELLFYMVRNKNIALSREKLISDIWGYDFFGDDRTLDTHIKLLRKSLGDYSKFIVTLRGMGYRFEG